MNECFINPMKGITLKIHSCRIEATKHNLKNMSLCHISVSRETYYKLYMKAIEYMCQL